MFVNWGPHCIMGKDICTQALINHSHIRTIKTEK